MKVSEVAISRRSSSNAHNNSAATGECTCRILYISLVYCFRQFIEGGLASTDIPGQTTLDGAPLRRNTQLLVAVVTTQYSTADIANMDRSLDEIIGERPVSKELSSSAATMCTNDCRRRMAADHLQDHAREKQHHGDHAGKNTRETAFER